MRVAINIILMVLVAMSAGVMLSSGFVPDSEVATRVAAGIMILAIASGVVVAKVSPRKGDHE